MKQIFSLILYLFLVVITNPYEGMNYEKINVYDVNYCNYYCNNNDSYERSQEDWEEIKNILKKDDSFIFDVDFEEEDE